MVKYYAAIKAQVVHIFELRRLRSIDTKITALA